MAAPQPAPPHGRRGLLERCRALERRLDPKRPPRGANHGEYGWQCRAFRERIEEMERLLEAQHGRARDGDTELRLYRMERALNVSLDFFHRTFRYATGRVSETETD